MQKRSVIFAAQLVLAAQIAPSLPGSAQQPGSFSPAGQVGGQNSGDAGSSSCSTNTAEPVGAAGAAGNAGSAAGSAGAAGTPGGAAGNAAGAVNASRAMPAVNPAVAARFNAAVTLYQAKKYKEAIEEFRAVTQADPRNSNALYYIANSYTALGDKLSAAKIYEYILKYFPQSEAAKASAEAVKALGSATETGAAATAAAHSERSTAADESRKAKKKADLKLSDLVPTSIASIVSVVRARADRPQVTKSSVTAIKSAVDGLPASVKQTLWISGMKIFVTPTVEDYQPGVKYEQARGYEGGTYKSCPAFYNNRRIVIAEHTMDENDETLKDAFPASEMINSLYHETGHALDDALGDVAETEEFKHAYLLDSARIDPATAHKLRYYLQKSTVGQAECCAELIGSLLGQKEKHTEDMMRSFPLTLKVLRGLLKI